MMLSISDLYSGCIEDYLILTIFFKSSIKEKRAGTKNIETKVESSKPPKTALPKPRYNSEQAQLPFPFANRIPDKRE
jgi:hypothetical protein